MICPKCGLEQPDAVECARCGIIVAKYKPKAQAPSPEAPLPPGTSRPLPGGPLPPGGFAPFPSPPPPPYDASGMTPGQVPPGMFAPPPGMTPGQVPPGMFAPPPGVASGYSAGQTGAGGASRFAGVSSNERRKVEAAEATRRLILILLYIGVAVMVLAVLMSVIKVFFDSTRFELDVSQAASDMGNSSPDAIRERLFKQAKQKGFEVKDNRINVIFTSESGADLAQMILNAGGMETWALNVTIKFTVIGRAMGIPIPREMRGGAHVVVKAYSHEVRKWLDQTENDYVGGRGPTKEEMEEEQERNDEPVQRKDDTSESEEVMNKLKSADDGGE